MTRRKEILLVTFFSVFYLFSHLINLTNIPVYLDEAIFISYANMVKSSEGLAYVSMQEGKTPLFMWVVSKTLSFFSDPLVSARVVSVFAGLGTMLCLYLLIRMLGHKKVGLFFLLLYCLLPFGFIIERLAFVDSLLVFFSSLSLLLLFGAANVFLSAQPDPIFAKNGSEHCKKIFTSQIISIILSILSGLSLGLAFYTKTSARLFFISFLTSMTVYIFIKFKNIKLIISKLFSLAIFSFIYLQSIDILRTASSRFWSSVGEKENELTFSYKEILANPINFYVQRNISELQDFFFFYITPILLIVLIIGFVAILTKKYRCFFHLLIIAAAALFGVTLSAKMFASRYVYLSYPFLTIIIAVGLSYLSEKIRKKMFAFVLISALILPIVIDSSIVFFTKYAFLPRHDSALLLCQGLSGYGIKESSDFIKEIAKKEKVTLGVDSMWGIPEMFGLYIKSPNLTVEKFTTIPSYTEHLLKEAKTHTVFVFLGINSLRLTPNLNAKPYVKEIFYFTRPACNNDTEVPARLLQIITQKD